MCPQKELLDDMCTQVEQISIFNELKNGDLEGSITSMTSRDAHELKYLLWSSNTSVFTSGDESFNFDEEKNDTILQAQSEILFDKMVHKYSRQTSDLTVDIEDSQASINNQMVPNFHNYISDFSMDEESLASFDSDIENDLNSIMSI